MKGPVCGMSVTKNSEHSTEHQGQRYHFCSERCLQKFKADPVQYIQTETSQSESLKDPVCSMAVTENSVHHTEHEGKKYYFCSAGCLNKFVALPDKYLIKNNEGKGCGCSSEKTASPESKSEQATMHSCCGGKQHGHSESTSAGAVDESAIYTCPIHQCFPI